MGASFRFLLRRQFSVYCKKQIMIGKVGFAPMHPHPPPARLSRSKERAKEFDTAPRDMPSTSAISR